MLDKYCTVTTFGLDSIMKIQKKYFTILQRDRKMEIGARD